MMNKEGKLKIIDFGLSNKYEADQTLQSQVGSAHYVAPEIVLQKPYNGAQVDIWSCGIIFFTMVAGYMPFDDDSGKRVNIFHKITKGNYRIPSDLSEQCKNLIRKILKFDPKSRPTIPEIKQHAFYRIMKYYKGSSLQKA